MKEEHPPQCPCCGEEMKESGLFETSEKFEVKPKKYLIERKKRVKYNCKCSVDMVNTQLKDSSIVTSSNYGDSLMIDAALSKYCDLIPMERYCAMASRLGVEDLPPHSLIGLTHHLANFLEPVYLKLMKEVMDSEVKYADETPHKMLEGDKSKNWYMWGFFCRHACYFEAHRGRSGDVAINFLKNCSIKYLMTDGYAGYKRAISELEKLNIIPTYCNAHAYRYFEDAAQKWQEECEFYLQTYGQIYELERSSTVETKVESRRQMRELFDQMKDQCEKDFDASMPGSLHRKALKYFLNHFDGVSRCCEDALIPLDNNFAERNLRSSVVGRKTLYGTHSKRGAKTNAVLFSLVESCKLNEVNPRDYFKDIVRTIHQNQQIYTPAEYIKSRSENIA